jgi:hypothetical protein
MSEVHSSGKALTVPGGINDDITTEWIPVTVPPSVLDSYLHAG